MTQLHLDLNAPTRTHDAVWAFGGSVCHASMLIRKDVRRHLMMCRDELGFRHVACRGMLGADMSVIGPDGAFSFDKIEPVMDWLLENGMVPFLRLAEPEPAAADASRWRELVKALATHVDGRYGCDAREWFFEIVPAASGDGPAGAASGDAFQSFDAILRAIKAVHPEYRVGWHAANGDEPLDRFMACVAAPPEGDAAEPPRCDFLTTDGCGDAATIRRKLSVAWGDATPLIVLGWGGEAAGNAASVHDECNHAAVIVRSAIELSNVCQGVVTRNISDIDAGGDRGPGGGEPFHDGRGLITVNDVRKGAFHALRLLHEHGGYHGERLASHWTDAPPGLACLATRSESTLRLLFCLTREPGVAGPVRFTIDGIPASVHDAQVEVIRPGAGSAFEAWTQLGKPQFVNREVLDALELASLPAQASVNFREYPPRLEPGMVMQLTINLPFDDVI
jgi:hypothetical protein